MKEWICKGNDCSKCKWFWETTDYYGEGDCGCYIRCDDFGDKDCHLINPFKFIIGTLKKKKYDYYIAHEYEGYADFYEQEMKKEQILAGLIKEELMEGKCICFRYEDGSYHECDTDLTIAYSIGNIKHGYEDRVHPAVNETILQQWKNVISNTLNELGKKTIGKIKPYITK